MTTRTPTTRATISSTALPPTALPPTALPPNSDVDSTLDRLLDAELDWSVFAKGGYISHLAMGLVAAARLGATSEQLDEQYRRSTTGDFLVARERPADLSALTSEIVERGITDVVSERLPDLIGNPGSQFFHSVIRLDLAVDSGHPGQVANALSNWSGDAAPPERGTGGEGNSSFAEVMARVADGERDAIVEIGGGAGLLDEITSWVASVHDEPDNFGTLHYVTGTRAVRAVSRFLCDEDRMTIALRLAQALVQITDRFGPSKAPGVAEVDQRRATAVPPWDEIGRTAVATADPHVMKLTYACLLEERDDGDAIHRWVAARQNHLV